MIRSSRDVVDDLIECGVDFQRDDFCLALLRAYNGSETGVAAAYYVEQSGMLVYNCDQYDNMSKYKVNANL